MSISSDRGIAMRLRALVIIATATAAVLGGLIPAVAASAASDTTTSNSTSQGDGVFDVVYNQNDADNSYFHVDLTRLQSDPVTSPWTLSIDRYEAPHTALDGSGNTVTVTDEATLSVPASYVHVASNGKTVALDPWSDAVSRTTYTFDTGTYLTVSTPVTVSGMWQVQGNDPILSGSGTVTPPWCTSADHYTDRTRPANGAVAYSGRWFTGSAPAGLVTSMYLNGTASC